MPMGPGTYGSKVGRPPKKPSGGGTGRKKKPVGGPSGVRKTTRKRRPM